MRFEVPKELAGEAVASEMLWLAWKACGGPVGMGFLQDNPRATKDEVWLAMLNASDYAGDMKRPESGEVAADYVFGRMMKLYFKFTPTTVEWADHQDPGDPDYNAWSGKYRSVSALYEAAVLSVIDKGAEQKVPFQL